MLSTLKKSKVFDCRLDKHDSFTGNAWGREMRGNPSNQSDRIGKIDEGNLFEGRVAGGTVSKNRVPSSGKRIETDPSFKKKRSSSYEILS